MPLAERQSFVARSDALPQLRAFVQERCRQLAVPADAESRLLVIAEELFLNSVKHGYGGDSAERVALALRDAGKEAELVVEDRAPAFDPFAQRPAEQPDPRTRPIGGQGVALVARLSSRHSYERVSGLNRITVAVVKDARPSQKKLPHRN